MQMKLFQPGQGPAGTGDFAGIIGLGLNLYVVPTARFGAMNLFQPG